MPLPVMQMPTIEDDVVIFQGGLDQKTPNLKLKPGHVRQALNWQCVSNEEGGGYQRVGGYERFDGQQSPSDAVGAYTLFVFDAFAFSAATYNASILDVSDYAGTKFYANGSGSPFMISARWFAVDATEELYAGQPYVGFMDSGVTGTVGATITARNYDIAGNDGTLFALGVLTAIVSTDALPPKFIAQLLNRSADRLRTPIAAPPGSGRILGVASLVVNGARKVYAWRNNAAGTAAVLYESSASGWTAVTMYHEVAFTHGGTIGDPTEPTDGSGLTHNFTTVTVKRVVHESGAWDAATAAGRLIIEDPTFPFVEGMGTVSTIPVRISGAQTPIGFLPNGTFQFDVYNFGGQLASKRLYGADGVNRAFEFDGEILVPINTYAPQDQPTFVRAHHFHLLLAIGSSIMGSGPGTPYKINAPSGGFEKGTGDVITGMLVQPGNQDTAACAIFGRNSSGVLYGTSAADFQYKALAAATGAIPYMMANLDQSYVYDDRGVLSFAAAQEYGNFKQAALTANLESFLTQRKSLAVGACVSMERSQFRLFFSDGSALYLTIVNGRMLGAMPQQVSHQFSCVWSAEDASGNEETFVGGQNGFVYQLDRGSSFDGEAIDHHLYFTHNFMKAPSIKKQFRNGHLEVQSPYYTEFSVGYRLSYGSTKQFQPVAAAVTAEYDAAAVWDSFVWDDYFWDGETLRPSEVEIKGKAEAIQIIISGSSDYIYPFTLSSLITHYNLTRRTR